MRADNGEKDSNEGSDIMQRHTTPAHRGQLSAPMRPLRWQPEQCGRATTTKWNTAGPKGCQSRCWLPRGGGGGIGHCTHAHTHFCFNAHLQTTGVAFSLVAGVGRKAVSCRVRTQRQRSLIIMAAAGCPVGSARSVGVWLSQSVGQSPPSLCQWRPHSLSPVGRSVHSASRWSS